MTPDLFTIPDGPDDRFTPDIPAPSRRACWAAILRPVGRWLLPVLEGAFLGAVIGVLTLMVGGLTVAMDAQRKIIDRQAELVREMRETVEKVAAENVILRGRRAR